MKKGIFPVVIAVCAIFSATLSLNTYAADTVKPVLTQVTPVKVRTNDTTPSYTFSSTEAGTIIYWGSCISTSRTAVAGNNTVIFSELAAGTYGSCSLSVKDAAGNSSLALAISSFTIDLVKPVLTVVTPVPANTSDSTPSYTFSSTEAGSIIYGGVCKSTQTTAIKGNNTVTFNTLAAGTYSACMVQVKDVAGNISLAKAINTFTVVGKPVLAVVAKVKSPTNDQTPAYTFSSSEAGAIIYGGACKSTQTAAIKGNNTISFNTLAAGNYSNCTVSIKNAFGNTSLVLNVNAFTIEITKPVLIQITAVPATGTDTTPNYTFSSTEDGSIIYGGDCQSITTKAYQGSNIITFNALFIGVVHSNCTIKIKDVAGNISLALSVPAFKIFPIIPTANNPKLNDTGITRCGDDIGELGAAQNNLICASVGTGISIAGIDADGDAVPAGQDALYGRDAKAATNTNSDGVAGFSYTKLDNNGAALEASATKWNCVQDNVTGLIWEVKTDDGGLRDKEWTYSWYNTDASNNGGGKGFADNSDNCYVATRCDTDKFVDDVNASKLCGANNWRLPSMQELQTLIVNNRINPAIDSNYFRNTRSSYYWSSSPYAKIGDSFAWAVDFNLGGVEWLINYSGGYIDVTNGKYNSLYVRVVRSGQ